MDKRNTYRVALEIPVLCGEKEKYFSHPEVETSEQLPEPAQDEPEQRTEEQIKKPLEQDQTDFGSLKDKNETGELPQITTQNGAEEILALHENDTVSGKSSMDNIQSETDALLQSNDASQDEQRAISIECMDSPSDILNFDFPIKLDFLEDDEKSENSSSSQQPENMTLMKKAKSDSDPQNKDDELIKKDDSIKWKRLTSFTSAEAAHLDIESGAHLLNSPYSPTTKRFTMECGVHVSTHSLRRRPCKLCWRNCQGEKKGFLLMAGFTILMFVAIGILIALTALKALPEKNVAGSEGGIKGPLANVTTNPTLSTEPTQVLKTATAKETTDTLKGTMPIGTKTTTASEESPLADDYSTDTTFISTIQLGPGTDQGAESADGSGDVIDVLQGPEHLSFLLSNI